MAILFNPLTQLNKIFDLATERNLSGTDQLVLLHIYNKFNRARWPETILVRDAELHELCRLYDTDGKPSSINAIRNAKARLKKHGLIDFTAGKGNTPTEYHLIRFYPVDTPVDTPMDTPVDTPMDTPVDTPMDTPMDTLPSCNIRVREDVKDVKTFSFIQSNAGARDSQELNDLLEYWERDLHGGRLAIEHQSEIEAWLNRYGFDWVKAVMREASDINGRVLNMKLLRGAVKYKLNPPKTKPSALGGGEKSEQRGDDNTVGGYHIPVYTGNEPWQSFGES